MDGFDEVPGASFNGTGKSLKRAGVPFIGTGISFKRAGDSLREGTWFATLGTPFTIFNVSFPTGTSMAVLAQFH